MFEKELAEKSRQSKMMKLRVILISLRYGKRIILSN